jgi:hypothetical protein
LTLTSSGVGCGEAPVPTGDGRVDTSRAARKAPAASASTSARSAAASATCSAVSADGASADGTSADGAAAAGEGGERAEAAPAEEGGGILPSLFGGGDEGEEGADEAPAEGEKKPAEPPKLNIPWPPPPQ